MDLKREARVIRRIGLRVARRFFGVGGVGTAFQLFLLTENGEQLLTESGEQLILE